MEIYLDNCALQRPLDDFSYIRIRLEAEAVVEILELVEAGDIDLLNSTVLEYELHKCADSERVEYGTRVLSLAKRKTTLSERVVSEAKKFEGKGVKAIDALHLAAAEVSEADYLCTCDDNFLKKAQQLSQIEVCVISPTDFVEEIGKQ